MNSRGLALSLRACRGRVRCFASLSLTDLRVSLREDIDALAESQALSSLTRFLDAKTTTSSEAHHSYQSIQPPKVPLSGYRHEMNRDHVRTTIDAMLATFSLHVEARIAAMAGHGFYTIGPCGEEALSSAAHALQVDDSVALHYRHLGINIARQLDTGHNLPDVLLERARGYTVSRLDPVTGGVHCSIGSTSGKDFIVTSTLASQCPPAVGRALGYAMRPNNNDISNDRERPLSFVTLGDGSVHNAHFWSAFHLARHARHKRVKCPVVFGISDNGLSISYSTGGYCRTLFEHDPLVPFFQANGNDMMDVYDKTKQAMDYSRRNSAPTVLLFDGLVRRFGHAATDRQFAYLSNEEIQSMAEVQTIESAVVQAVDVYSAMTYAEVRDRFAEIRSWTAQSFDRASEEKKATRQDMLEQVAPQPLKVTPSSDLASALTQKGKKEVMRKHMTRVLDECLGNDDTVVYLGEDVEHGGYYLVTDGLAKKYKGRVLDFPPDETSLLGAALGFSQVGLTPIVEIPYAKYLDCGADMFHEIAVMHWLSSGQSKQGMLIRLQGFDRGLFGGNFHTHNMLPHMPPGVDVVCFSNGQDYVRGFRHALDQAKKAGRIVMMVDCTALLNQRHLHEKDRGWETSYPERKAQQETDGSISSLDHFGFDSIRRYGTKGRYAIISYGNGVPTALQARRELLETKTLAFEDELDIIDCPCLSAVPQELRDVLPQYEAVLFADITKEGPGCVLSHYVTTLQSEDLLPARWRLAAAPRTYNPLGSLATFLNVDDVTKSLEILLSQG